MYNDIQPWYKRKRLVNGELDVRPEDKKWLIRCWKCKKIDGKELYHNSNWYHNHICNDCFWENKDKSLRETKFDASLAEQLQEMERNTKLMKNKCQDPKCSYENETVFTKCDKCKKKVCMWHIMGDGTSKGEMYCDDCLVERKKEIKKCSHEYDGAVLLFGKKGRKIECKKCGLIEKL